MRTCLKVAISTPDIEGPSLNLPPHHWTALWVLTPLGLRVQNPTDQLGRCLPESSVWATATMKEASYFYTTGAGMPSSL